MRATWLTDLHLDFLDEPARRAFGARIADERPDVLLVTGDIGQARSVLDFVDELAAIAPIYFVLGNHDYYGATIADVRARAARHGRWLPALGPVRLTAQAALVGVDGWGDARCGDLASPIELSDWHVIGDFADARRDRGARNQILQRLGAAEADALRGLLARAPACDELIVLTHVPPFEDACVHDGARSEPAWLPWFTCVATGEVLAAHARTHPRQTITVLCGHTHGVGTCRPLPNLEVRTGGWPRGALDYGNPIVHAGLVATVQLQSR